MRFQRLLQRLPPWNRCMQTDDTVQTEPSHHLLYRLSICEIDLADESYTDIARFQRPVIEQTLQSAKKRFGGSPVIERPEIREQDGIGIGPRPIQSRKIGRIKSAHERPESFSRNAGMFLPRFI